MKGFMKAAAIDGFGPPSVLGLHQLPIPEPGPDEILIALTAAGVGVWDAEVRDGSWQPAGKPKFPFVLGTDGAGMVAAKGARVDYHALYHLNVATLEQRQAFIDRVGAAMARF